MKWFLILTAYASTTILSFLSGAAGQWVGTSSASWSPSYVQSGGGGGYDINYYDKKKSSSASDESFYNSANYNQVPSYYSNNGNGNWGWNGNQMSGNPSGLGGGGANWGWPGNQISVGPPNVGGGGANWYYPGNQISVGPQNVGGGGANWWYPGNQVPVRPPIGGYLTQREAESGCGNCWLSGVPGSNIDPCAGCRFPNNYPPMVPNYISALPPREDVSWLAVDKNNNNRQNILLESGRKTLP